MEKNKRVSKEKISTIVDCTTGEVQTTSDVKEYLIDGEPDYVKLYLKDIGRIFGLPAGSSSVMFELLKRMDYDNLIAVTPVIRQVMAKNCGTSVDVINHSISKLIAEGIFTKVGSGTYMANPDLFARGKWVDIKNMRLSITYDSLGRSFKCEKNIEKDQELPLDIKKQAISGLPIYICT